MEREEKRQCSCGSGQKLWGEMRKPQTWNSPRREGKHARMAPSSHWTAKELYIYMYTHTYNMARFTMSDFQRGFYN